MASWLFVRPFVSGHASATSSLPAGTGVAVDVGLAAYGGGDTSAPVDAKAELSGTRVTATVPALTTTKADTLVLRMVTNAGYRP